MGVRLMAQRKFEVGRSDEDVAAADFDNSGLFESMAVKRPYLELQCLPRSGIGELAPPPPRAISPQAATFAGRRCSTREIQ